MRLAIQRGWAAFSLHQGFVNYLYAYIYIYIYIYVVRCVDIFYLVKSVSIVYVLYNIDR